MSGIPWRDLLRFGLCELRLSPDDFWSQTPAELLLMSGVENGAGEILLRSELSELMKRYPDADAGGASEEK